MSSRFMPVRNNGKSVRVAVTFLFCTDKVLVRPKSTNGVMARRLSA